MKVDRVKFITMLFRNLVVLIAVVLCMNLDVFAAYGDKIQSTLDTSITWTCRVIGGAIFSWGLFQFFAHLSQDDPNAWKMARNKIIGGVGFALVKDIVDLFQSFVK